MSKHLERLGLLIKKVQHRHHRLLDAQLTANLGVSLVQWGALREIHRNPTVSMHQLAQLTFNSDQAFGTLTTRLLRSGLIKRSPGNGRTVLHSLTERGKRLLQQGRNFVVAALEQSFAALSEEECAVLLGLFTKLLTQGTKSGKMDKFRHHRYLNQS
jgi:DNA-binding MarR family transcriptional regulator